MKRQIGVSLVEVMLVLAIGGFLVMMGLRQYMSYRLDADVALIKSNVDTIYAAMSSYFQANCGGAGGTLSPYNKATDFTAAKTIDISADLVKGHYLNQSQVLAVSLVVGSPDQSTILSGYKARFMPTKVERPAMPTQSDQVNYTWTNTESTGWIVMWTPQIMVELKDPNKAKMLQLLTQATSCTKTDWQSQGACDAKTPALFFTHQVSFTNHAGAGSDYWVMSPMLNQMRDQEGIYNPAVVLSAGSQDDQFYYCGG